MRRLLHWMGYYHQGPERGVAGWFGPCVVCGEWFFEDGETGI